MKRERLPDIDQVVFCRRSLPTLEDRQHRCEARASRGWDGTAEGWRSAEAEAPDKWCYPGLNSRARRLPSVRQSSASAALPETWQRSDSLASARRASRLTGCPGQSGVDGQASVCCRLRQRVNKSEKCHVILLDGRRCHWQVALPFVTCCRSNRVMGRGWI